MTIYKWHSLIEKNGKNQLKTLEELDKILKKMLEFMSGFTIFRRRGRFPKNKKNFNLNYRFDKMAINFRS
jgi:hypothetical protein